MILYDNYLHGTADYRLSSYLVRSEGPLAAGSMGLVEDITWIWHSLPALRRHGAPRLFSLSFVQVHQDISWMCQKYYAAFTRKDMNGGDHQSTRCYVTLWDMVERCLNLRFVLHVTLGNFLTALSSAPAKSCSTSVGVNSTSLLPLSTARPHGRSFTCENNAPS